jgi:hypothetical protein
MHQHLAAEKRFPLFSFHRSWNEEEAKKHIQTYKIYSKQIKMSSLLASLIA